jgi:CheY-like chemotaxis protein
MGYQLNVESEVGKGSAFSILVSESVKRPPRAEDQLIAEALKPMESSRPRQDVPAGVGGGTRRSVLIIDDDPDSRILLAHYVDELGHDVLLAGSAGDGLAQARAVRPDLITLDLMMPGVTGWEALREFKADPELRDIPVVVVSLVGDEGDRSSLLGAMDVVTKPIQRESLLRAIERNLDDTRNRVVLVVEDDADTRTVMKGYLEDAGLEVVLAENGEEAMERLRDEIPDLILLDIVMPVMDGTTFLKRLREGKQYLGIPVIVCTDEELTREEYDRLKAQAAAILMKGEDFEAKLKRTLSGFFPAAKGSDSPP